MFIKVRVCGAVLRPSRDGDVINYNGYKLFVEEIKMEDILMIQMFVNLFYFAQCDIGKRSGSIK